MKRRTRYLLLLMGFIFFLITAPLIVLYLSGITYDFSNNRYVKTGIVVANTEPDNAQVYIDGSLADTSPARVKFVAPGEHDVALQKDGYFTWSKRLDVKQGKVTWAASENTLINLLRENPESEVWAKDVLDFDFYKDGIIYITEKNLVIAPDPENDEAVIPLPKPFNSFILSPNGELVLLIGSDANRFVYSLDTQTLYDITGAMTPATQLSFSSTDEILTLNTGELGMLNYIDATIEPLASNIASVTTFENALYALRGAGQGYELITFNRNASPANAQVLATTPAFSTSHILVTKQKEIFVLGNGSVYTVGTELNRLVDGVTSWHYYPEQNSLLFASPSELHRYTIGVGVELISRSGTAFNAPLLHNNTGYVFFGQDGFFQALELDRRDHQNNYRIFPASTITKILSKHDGQDVYLLDNGTVVALEVM